MTETPSIPRRRLPVIDMARGVAIVAMVIYHLSWDLSYFGFIGVDVGYDPAWVAFARSILFAFTFLVGVGLLLGHGETIRWRAFWRRWLMVAGGAAIITISTRFTFPDSFVYFGVLHAIALFSLLALPFLRQRAWLTALVALGVIAAGVLYSNPAFDAVPLSWIGFWVVPPLTNDLVPVFPWFGVTLLGVAGMKVMLARDWTGPLAQQPGAALGRWLGVLGRFSLLIYLLHQPLLLAVIYPASQVLGTQTAGREAQFLSSCQASCEAGGTTAALCATYCQCGLEGVERDNLWEPIFSGLISAGEQAQLDANNRVCSALIYPDLDLVPAQSDSSGR